MTKEDPSEIRPESVKQRDSSEEESSGDNQKAILERLKEAERKLEARPSREWIYQRMGIVATGGVAILAGLAISVKNILEAASMFYVAGQVVTGIGIIVDLFFVFGLLGFVWFLKKSLP